MLKSSCFYNLYDIDLIFVLRNAEWVQMFPSWEELAQSLYGSEDTIVASVDCKEYEDFCYLFHKVGWSLQHSHFITLCFGSIDMECVISDHVINGQFYNGIMGQ